MSNMGPQYMRAHLRGWRAARKTAGICRDCPATITVGVRCQACREWHAATERASYRRRKARREQEQTKLRSVVS